jgi:DNA-directed RNA polymerase sigma subunit (sigma70/sigma32)
MDKSRRRVHLTCFEAHQELKKSCENSKCRMWMKMESNNNCTILSAKSGPKTLQEIGDIFGVTRMRICQIEKTILRKLSRMVENESIT